MAKNQQLLTDIRLHLQHRELRPMYTVATDRRRVYTPTKREMLQDIGIVSGLQNLGQAIILRLLTPRGELSALGHPEYGSRLHEVIGVQNTETIRNLIKLYILESLQMESRIEKVEEVTVEPVRDSQGRVRDRVNVLLKVEPIGEAETVTIGPFTLELEQ